MQQDPVGALESLADASDGPALPLPPALADLYGTLRFPDASAPPPPRSRRPYILSNFVSSLDGVVSLGTPRTGGAEISGGSREDRVVMGLLRAVVDVVIVGSGTLRAFPRHLWTPEAIDPDRGGEYAQLRASLGKSPVPITVVVTATGDLDPSLPVFASGQAVVVTSEEGETRLARHGGARLDVRVAGRGPSLDARDVLAVLRPPADTRILLEGGPRLMASFLEAAIVDELFLTLAPQVIGRTSGGPREGLTSGVLFFPHRPLWARLISVKSRRDLLFLRYGIPRDARSQITSGPKE
jgi:riboflavin biosynthesis pyrimidine reductase